MFSVAKVSVSVSELADAVTPHGVELKKKSVITEAFLNLHLTSDLLLRLAEFSKGLVLLPVKPMSHSRNKIKTDI